MKIWSAIAAVCIASFVVAGNAVSAADARPTVSQRIEARKQIGAAVSMYRVIANREVFDGKRIVVWGYLSVGDQSASIWPNKTAYDHGPEVDGIYIDLNPKQVSDARSLHGHWVMVEGTFHAKAVDGEVEFSGVLKSVTRLKGWD